MSASVVAAPPRLLDGVRMAAEIKAEVATDIALLQQNGIRPGLAVVLVGDNPASAIYVRSKQKACDELGIYSELITPPSTVSTEDLLALIHTLNHRHEIDGILIQLPLPAQVDTRALLEAVHPDKDVDGFHPINAGRLEAGRPGLVPCTPAGIIEILRRTDVEIAGKHAVVVGRSNIVGKPVSIMLLNACATVTTCHRHTLDLPSFTRSAEILVTAVGRPGLITPDMVRPGAILIDVGINRITDPDEFARLFPNDPARAETFARRGSVVTGDIAPAALARSSAYTPVPGGVGALTIAMLMRNTIRAARLRRGLIRL